MTVNSTTAGLGAGGGVIPKGDRLYEAPAVETSAEPGGRRPA